MGFYARRLEGNSQIAAAGFCSRRSPPGNLSSLRAPAARAYTSSFASFTAREGIASPTLAVEINRTLPSLAYRYLWISPEITSSRSPRRSIANAPGTDGRSMILVN